MDSFLKPDALPNLGARLPLSSLLSGVLVSWEDSYSEPKYLEETNSN